MRGGVCLPPYVWVFPCFGLVCCVCVRAHVYFIYVCLIWVYVYLGVFGCIWVWGGGIVEF